MSKIYRGYDRSELDLQYNPRLSVDFQSFADRWARTSAEIRASAAARLDLAYGPSPEETLDVYLARGERRPIHLYFHGGYWRALNKVDFAYIAPGFRPSDTICVVVNYALCPAVTIGEIVRQCETAVAWVWKNAHDFGGDPGRISVSGHSAGGHITAMLMATDWGALGCPPDVIKKAVALSGLYDLEPLRLSFLNEFIRLTPQSVRDLSPINHVGRSRVPLLISAGGAESDEFRRQSDIFEEAWLKAGNVCKRDPAAGLDHYSIMDAAYDPRTDLGVAIFDWIAQRDCR